MKIVKPARVAQFKARHPTAGPGLEQWLQVAKAATWRRFADVRLVHRSADEVRVSSGRKVVVFNIGHGFRLLTAIHYNRLKVFVMRFLTHAEYDKNQWKDQL
ncbi:MAG: type II toxin-antitoxin system HigB family toxin [Phycisphaeraceae bacterium]